MRRGSLLLVVQSLFGLALLAAWLLIVDIDALLASLSSVDWGAIGLMAGLGLVSITLRSMRWRRVLAPVVQIGLLELLSIGLASSLINFVIPIRSGEIARGVFLKQRHSVRMSVSLPTVAVDRSLDLLAVVLIGVVGAIGGMAIDRSVSLVILLGAGFFLAFAALVAGAAFAQERLVELAGRLIPQSLAAPLRERVVGILEGFVTGFATIGKQPRMLVSLLVLSLLAAVVDSAVFLVLFASLDATIAPLTIMVGYALFAITFLVPGGPGYVGSMEAFGSLVFGGLGVESALAATAVVVFHALNAVMLAAGGGTAFWVLGVRPGQVLRSALEGRSRVSPETGEGL